MVIFIKFKIQTKIFMRMETDHFYFDDKKNGKHTKKAKMHGSSYLSLLRTLNLTVTRRKNQ